MANSRLLSCAQILKTSIRSCTQRQDVVRALSTKTGNKNLIKDHWTLKRLNHIAIATSDLQKAVSLYRDVLRAEVSDAVPLPDHGVITVFVNVNNTKIELLTPLGEKSPIQNFLDKNKDGGMHHICFDVDDIQFAMAELKENGVRCLGKEPKIGAHGKPVIFLHPKDCGGVLVELEEDAPLT